MDLKYNEFSKISIHCHLGGKNADCTIDKKSTFTSNFDLSQAYSQANDANECGFSLLGMTNHNSFDAASYLLLKKYCALKQIELLPGVEIDLQNWEDYKKTIHLVLLIDPSSNLFLFQEKLRGLYKENINIEKEKKPDDSDCFFLSLQQLSEIATSVRSILCFHGIKQKDKSIANNPELAEEICALSRFLPVAIEDNQAFHKIKLENILKEKLSEKYYKWLLDAASVSSSDQTLFKDITSPTYIWAGNSFDDLFYSVLVGEKRVIREQDVINRTAYISKIKINKCLSMDESEVVCSHGLNSIIGPSGSGKTLLLELLKRKLSGQHLTENTSNISKYDNLYKLNEIHLFDPFGQELDENSGYKVIELENLYQRIIKAYSSDSTSLIDEFGLKINDELYRNKIKSFENDINSYLKNQIRRTELEEEIHNKLALIIDSQKFINANSNNKCDSSIGYSKDSRVPQEINDLKIKENNLKRDIENVTNILDRLQSIAEHNQLSKEIFDLIDSMREGMLSELTLKVSNIIKKKQEKELKNRKDTLIYNAVQKYNEIISAQSTQVNSKYQQINDDFQCIAQDCLELKNIMLKEDVPSLDGEELKNSLSLSTQHESVLLDIEGVNLNHNDAESLKRIFPGSIGNYPKVKKSKFNSQYDLSNKDDVKNLISIFHNEKYKESLTVFLPYKDIIKYKIKIRTENGEYKAINELSAGQLSKAYVSNFLDQSIRESGSNSIVIFDQPESNMEKSFLQSVLADKFNQLRQTHQIFIATHEPLLVVNSDSNEIILAINEKKIDEKSHILYKNKSFVGTSGKSDLVKEIADLIDGGTEAVKQRNDIYEGMKS